MRSTSIREIKAKFSTVLAMVRRGERICGLYGREMEPVAMSVPYETERAGKRDIGLLDDTVRIEFMDDYEMDEDELLGAETEEGR